MTPGQGYALKLTAARFESHRRRRGIARRHRARRGAAAAGEEWRQSGRRRRSGPGGRPARRQQAGAGDRTSEARRRRDHPQPDRSDGMAAAHDAGGAHRAAQARVCRDPRTDRRWRFNLPDLGRPFLHGRSYRTAARRDGRPRAQAEGDASGGSRHDPHASQLRAGGEGAGGGNAGASLPLDASLLSIVANLEGPRSRWVAPSMRRPVER